MPLTLNQNQAIALAAAAFKAAGIKNPYFEAELLLSAILNKPRATVLAHPEANLTARQLKRFLPDVEKRVHGLPLAYLVGHKEFYGLDFLVDKNVLIPRPETELTVDEAFNILKHSPGATVVDIGTGSGCIIISLISNFLPACRTGRFPISKELSNFKIIKKFRFLATDISLKALVIARRNAKRHNMEKFTKFYHGDLLEPIIHKSKILSSKSEIIILANLPYLTLAQIKNSPAIKFEPRLALEAGADGLRSYRRLFRQIRTLRGLSGLGEITACCEIDPGQKTAFPRLLEATLPNAAVKIKKDLKGHARLAIIKL